MKKGIENLNNNPSFKGDHNMEAANKKGPAHQAADAADDKAEVIKRAILRAAHGTSDRAIAKAIKVSNRSVSKHRKLLEKEGLCLKKVTSTQGIEACHQEVCTWVIQKAPENDSFYSPVQEEDPSFQALVESIRKNGLNNPLGVSSDGYIFDGHRRFAAVKHLGWEKVQIRIRPDISYHNERDKFLEYLVSCNQQRVKTTDEFMREGIAGMEDETWQRLCTYRQTASELSDVEAITLYGEKRRSEIRDKMGLKNAITNIVYANKRDWPLSDRKVFYLLLNVEGLLRNDRTKVPFENAPECYDDVTDMVTRLRLDRSIPFDSIGDETRPVSEWNTHKSVDTFINEELDNLFSGYWRDLLQSQPNWIELLVEKNTVASSLREVAAKYTVPMTSGRGYSSLPPRKNMLDRFKASGREKLVLIVVSDFDPEGEDIPNAFGISLRDDFNLDERKLHIVKAALTYSQVQTLSLHEGQLAKEHSSRYQRFTEKYGNRCWELEAVPTDTLRQLIEGSIRNVLDLDAFNQELEKQKQEQEELNVYRQEMKEKILKN